MRDEEKKDVCEP